MHVKDVILDRGQGEKGKQQTEVNKRNTIYVRIQIYKPFSL